MENVLYYGDNLNIFKRYIKDETIDLIYLDPPFNTNRDFNILFKEKDGKQSTAQLQAYDDTWIWNSESSKAYFEVVELGGMVSKVLQSFRTFLGDVGMLAYLSMMAIRLKELHRVLKDTGSIYLHCDPTMSHYLKILMDAVFGVGNFRNDISWRRGKCAGNTKSGQFPRNHDSLLCYSKTDICTYERILKPYAASTLKMYCYDDGDDKGKYCTQALGDYSPSSIKKMEEQNLIVTSKTGNKRFKQYFAEKPGVTVDDIWEDINPTCYTSKKEQCGYPTQKPEALLERIIKVSSKEGDVVLDPFVGGGTTLVVAEKLGRKWIGIDISPASISIIKQRLLNSDYDIIGYYPFDENKDVLGNKSEFTSEEIEERLIRIGKLIEADKGRYGFEWSFVEANGGRKAGDKRVKGADGGIDGKRTFLNNGKLQKIYYSAKSGLVDVGQVRDLLGAMDLDGAPGGVLLCHQKPTQPMIDAAEKAGSYIGPFGKLYPKIQILTTRQWLEGKRLELPL